MNLSFVFEKILLKPELYLGTVSVTRLHAYLKGYVEALQAANVPYNDDEFGNFAKWMEKKFHLNVTNSWAEIVLFKSFGDEHRAMELTKMLWIEFKKESSINSVSD